MIRNFVIIGVALLFLMGTPANASLIQWNLENVSEVSNPTLSFTGFFDYDTSLGTTSASPDFSITELVSGSPTTTWTTSNGGTGTFSISGSGPQFSFFSSEVPGGGTLIVANSAGFDGSISVMPLINSVIAAPGMGPSGVTGSVSDLTAVPLPGGLSVFALAILALGLTSWRKSRLPSYKLIQVA